MPKQQTDSHGAGAEVQNVRLRDSLMEQYVIHALGPPESLYGVQVRPLWGRCYRVNVLVGADAVSAKVLHSYFLVTDEVGKVLTSTPTIVRQYGVDDGRAADTGTASTADERGFGG
jgi:hypothetical protein